MSDLNTTKVKLVNTIKNLPRHIQDKLGEANVFFSEEYQKYANISKQDMLYAFDSEFIIPICISRRFLFQYALFISEPYSHGGNGDIEKKAQFLNNTIESLKHTKIAWISTSAGSLFDVYPNNSVRIPFGSHVVDLTLSEDELWGNVHSKHRNSIRRAEKGNVEIRSGGKELIKDYVLLDKETWARSGKNSYGSSFFENIVEGLGSKSQIVIAYKDDIPQAGGVFFKNTQMSYYMYGTSADHPEPGAANLLQWNTMLRFKREGVKKYSFVGCRINEDEDSKYHNIQRFKERFGGELVQGYMFRTEIHHLIRKEFMALYKMKNKKELVDAIDMELHKWSELNQ